MENKKLLLTLFFLIGLSVVNCSKEYEACPPLPYNNIDIQGIDEIVHTSDSIRILPDSSEVSFDDYQGFFLFYSFDYIVSNQRKASLNTNFGSLYALSCVTIGDLRSKEVYSRIDIVTLNDIDYPYFKGDTINDLIQVDGFIGSYGIPIEDYLNEVSTGSSTIGRKLSFHIEQQPRLSNVFQCKIYIELSNGESFEKVSQCVIFK